jgi:polysaccharide biosynthesis transport protein
MNAIQQPIAPYLLRPLRKRGTPHSLPEVEHGTVTELWSVLKRRWRVIALSVIVLVGATSVYCLVATPWYSAKATVLIEARAPQAMGEAAVSSVQDPFTSAKYDYYQTQFQLLKSPTLARRVIEDLQLARDPRFNTDEEARETAGAEVRPGLVAQYLQQLTVLPLRGTRLVTVEFESIDPDVAADVANAHARLFVRAGLERVFGAMDHMRGFLQSKLGELQDRMQEAEANLLKFQNAHHLLPVDLGKDVASERMTDLSRRLTAAEGERIGLEAQYSLIERGDPDSLPAVLGNPLIQKLREEYDKLEVERALLAGKFTNAYPRMQQVNAQLAHAKRLLDIETDKVVKGVEANYLASQRTVDSLKAELEGQRNTLLGRKDAEGEFLTLTREAETTRSLYDNVLTRVKSLDISGGADSSNISIAEPAMPPRKPTSPDAPFAIGLSFATSLLLGVGFAFLRDTWDHTIRNSGDIRRVTGLGTLAVVPDFDIPVAGSAPARLKARAQKAGNALVHVGNGNGDGKGSRLVIGNGSVPPLVEAYRTLRTSLLLSRATSPRVILVASASGTEGKTTTAVNTAAALASCGANVLLIDGDLRLPRCHESLGLDSHPGLTEYLAGHISTAPYQATHLPNLTFLAAGDAVGNPTELLTCWLLPSLLRQARERFDFVIVDSPPILAVSDGLLLADLADGVVFVAERGKSRQDDVRLALQRLQQAGAVPLGAVLNRGGYETEYYRYYGRDVADHAGKGSPSAHAEEPQAPSEGATEPR